MAALHSSPLSRQSVLHGRPLNQHCLLTAYLFVFAAVAFARQDEALDTMALEEVEAVPR
jgi:hypothetical protein